ncbi:MAG: hypothetical protein FWD53_01650 [Phycisphaerales bacterium]|nr:hypothetical protein [Phycisphaerales bacterium]
MTNRPPDNVLSYESRFPTRLSRLAVIAFAASLYVVPGFFLMLMFPDIRSLEIIKIILALCLILAPIASFILAIIARHRINKHPQKLAGLGFTRAASNISGITICTWVLLIFLLPATSRGHYAPRSSCAANLRGIMNAMVIYAAQNSEHFPVVTYAPYSPALNDPAGTPPFTAAGATADDVVNSYFAPPAPSLQAGSVSANAWMLVLLGVSPKLFVCKSDPHATDIASLQAPSGRYYYNFQNDKQLSYSFSYPWISDGSVAPWWRNTSDASIPTGSDMAPQHGTGTPRRNLTPASMPRDSKTWNSGNHGGEGQNVAFADVHVDYVKVPTVGQSNDNIFTTSDNPSLGPTKFDDLPATKSPPNLSGKGPPYDIIMYPVRNLDTGRL